MCARIFIVCAAILLSACSGKVSGIVYLDSNGNGVMEGDEPRLSNVLIKAIDEKNELIGTFTTDDKGKYTIGISGPGDYCVIADVTSLGPSTGLSVSGTGGGKAATVGKDWFAGGGTTLGTQDQGTNTTGTQTQTQTGTGSTGTTNTTSTTSTSSGTADSSSTSSTSSTTASTIQRPSDALCSKTTALSVEINVPVKRNYTAALSQYPAPTKQTYESGESFSLNIPHPAECTLESIYLPDSLELAHTTKPQPIQFDVGLNQVTFIPSSAESQPVAVNAAALNTTELNLRVRDDVPPGEYDVALHPKAICPGNQEIEMPGIQFTVKAEPALKVSLSLVKAPALGSTVQITAEVKNASGVKYKDVQLVVAAPSTLTFASVDALCGNLGSKAECNFAVNPNSSAKRTLSLQMPKELTQTPTQFTIEAKAVVAGVDEPIMAEAIVFSLEDPALKDK